MSAEGLDELEIKLDQLADVDLNKAIGNAIQTVRSTAVMNVHVDTGELRQSIYAEVEDNGDTATGVCWTNKPYATYLEFWYRTERSGEPCRHFTRDYASLYAESLVDP